MSELVAYVSLKSNLNNKFLRYNAEKGEYNSFLRCSGEQKLNPLSKFAMEPSQSNEPRSYLVHLRSCYNNKYLVRNAPDGDWIVVRANEKEEDQSKWSCTLFKPIMLQVDEGGIKKTVVRFQHIQSGEYACLSNATTTSSITGKANEDISINTYAGLSKNAARDGDMSDTYTVTYWTPMDVLPQYVAFKGNNGKYLTNYVGLQFLSTDIADSGVANEIVMYEDQMKIKQIDTNCYWEAYAKNRVLAYDEWIIGPDKSFEAIKLDTNVIALKSVDNNLFCGIYSGGNYPDCMYCIYDSINNNVRLTIDEHVVSRRIIEVVYDFDNAKIYDVQDVTFIRRTYKNHGTNAETYTLEVNDEHSRTKVWNSTVTTKLGIKTEVSAGVPFIADAKIETSMEFSGEYQWGKSETETFTLKDTLPVTVDPGKQRTASCVSKKGKCDLPFTYVQIDLLYNGNTVTKNLGDGIYTGANFYDFVFEAGPNLPITSTQDLDQPGDDA